MFRFPSKDFWPFWPPQPTSLWRSCVGSRPAQPRHPAQQAPPQAPQTPLWGWGRCRLGRRHLKRQGRCCRCRPGAHHPREETHLDHFLLPVLRSFDKEKGTPQYLKNVPRNGGLHFNFILYRTKGLKNNINAQSDGTLYGLKIGAVFNHCSSTIQFPSCTLSRATPLVHGSVAWPWRSVPTAGHHPSLTAGHPRSFGRPLLPTAR